MAFEIQALSELRPNGTEFEDGTFVLEWDVDKNGGEAAPTMDEIKTKAQQIENEIPIRHLRKERDRLLFETYCLINLDVPLSTRTKWVSYRQALRDLPATTLDVTNPTWPTKPS